MKIPWKTTLIGLTTGGLLAAALAGTLILHRASASQSAAPPPQNRAVSTQDVYPRPDEWLDDAGGTVPVPQGYVVLRRCQADELTLSLRPERSHYGSGELVILIFDARFKGVSPCLAGGRCYPDITVRDAHGRVVWDSYNEVGGGGACASAPTVIASRPSQHFQVRYPWRQDDCGWFCHDDTRMRAAPAGQYTAIASWRPFGSTPPSQAFFTLE